MFPATVNEKAARVVAAGAVTLSIAILATGWHALTLVLAYGFVARVIAGPRFSPLALLATRVVAPRLGEPRTVAGPPKRFAQGIGATLSLTAVALWLAGGPVWVPVSMIAAAASLEAGLGFCLGCKIYALVRPDDCPDCADLSGRLAASSASR